jgi:hypothetical protein
MFYNLDNDYKLWFKSFGFVCQSVLLCSIFRGYITLVCPVDNANFAYAILYHIDITEQNKSLWFQEMVFLWGEKK